MCANARDAIEGIGKVVIETTNIFWDKDIYALNSEPVSGEYVLLTVRDNGCGMNKKTLSKLFDPFFTKKKTGQGTGLGLATVYGIVKQNNGYIHVYSEPGQGTTFKIYFPRSAAEGIPKPKQTTMKHAMSGHETILLVEDEPMILDITMTMLKNQGYNVLSAKSPSEAIRIALEYTDEIHLLVTDLIMPEMNGQELAENLLSYYPNLKQLLMSGYTADIIAHHGILDDGINFIQKPFSAEYLSTTVRNILDS